MWTDTFNNQRQKNQPAVCIKKKKKISWSDWFCQNNNIKYTTLVLIVCNSKKNALSVVYMNTPDLKLYKLLSTS